MSRLDPELVRQSNAQSPLQQYKLAVDAESDQHFHELLHALPVGVYTTDAAGRITFFNETAAAMWGRRPELNSEKWCGSWRMYWPDGTELPHDECPMAIAMQEQRTSNGTGHEAVVERPDGTRVPFMAFPSILRDSMGNVIGAVNMFVDITERKRSEEQISILAREAEHRAKNMLATVQATVHLSQSDTAEGLKHAIEGRIQALANVHRLFVQSRWAGAELHGLVSQELSPYGQDGETRVRIEGPNLSLEPDAAQTIAVTLHELATNAAKYGALSVPTGRVLSRVVTGGRRQSRASLDRNRWAACHSPHATRLRHAHNRAHDSANERRYALRLACGRTRMRDRHTDMTPCA